MTIIVTGGAGFIGSNFVFHMLNKYPDYRIVCLDCLTYAGNLSTLEPVMDNPNFRFVKESITDREAVYKLFEEEKPDMVVNFAAESHVDRSIENPEVFLDTNIKVQQFLWMPAENMVSNVTIRYLQMRFTEIFHWTDQTCSYRETQSTQAAHTVHTKAGADLLVLAYHRTYGLPVTISRCSKQLRAISLPREADPAYDCKCTE